ncbi:MAG: septum formation protein Maf [Myxococcales bacterium]|nr:septum formation protein Maf [Myxococcales bacterium]
MSAAGDAVRAGSSATPALVVATTSRYRLELLGRLGVPFSSVAHRCDEDAFKGCGKAPRELACALAREKAESVAADHPGAFVLGSDLVCVLGDEILSKPGSPARAEAQLARLSGATHQLITALALRHPGGRVAERVSVHPMRMRPLTPEAIARYVAADEPLDCAGSYKIEGRGIALFESIGGDDFTGIVGLSLIALTDLLLEAGFEVL